MALPAIDATVSGADANSYDTLANANAYFELHPMGQIWADAEVEDRTRSLLFAVVLINRETFFGQVSNGTQAMKFPRTCCSNLIPDTVKHAQFEQALDLLTGGYAQRLNVIEMKEMGVRQITAAETMQRMGPSFPFAFPMYKLSPTARELISRWMENTYILGRS